MGTCSYPALIIRCPLLYTNRYLNYLSIEPVSTQIDRLLLFAQLRLLPDLATLAILLLILFLPSRLTLCLRLLPIQHPIGLTMDSERR